MQQGSKLLMINYYFPPVKVVGAVRLFHIYQESLKYFEEVHVLTTRNRQYFQQDPSLEIQPLHLEELPTWDLRRLLLRRQGANTLTHRVKQRPWVKFFTRLTDSFPFNLLWGDGGLVYILAGYRRAARLVREQGITHLFSSFRPYADHAIACLLKKRFPDLTWVADFRDLHVDPVRKNTFISSLQQFLNRQILQKATIITTVSKGLARELHQYNRKVYVLRNGIDPQSFCENVSQEPTSFFKITYTGSLYPELQTAKAFFEGIHYLVRSTEKNILDDIQLVYAGKDHAIWKEWLNNQGLEGLTKIHSNLSKRDAIKLQQTSQVNLLLTWSSNEVGGILTAKLYEYLAAGIPILALVNGPKDSELEHLIEDNYAGKVFYPGESNEIADFLARQFHFWKSDPYTYSNKELGHLRHYSWPTQMSRFIDFLSGDE